VSARRVTIADVAIAAGVSVATVSKVINDRYGVAEATSVRVREAIAELGYTSSLVAQSLRSRRSGAVGILAFDIEPFSSEVIQGCAEALRDTGYDLIVFSGCGRSHDPIGWEHRALGRVNALADGIILIAPSSMAVEASAPIVCVDHNAQLAALPTVDSDNHQGGVTATQYLISLGHRRIGFVAGREDLESAHQREQGYRHALEGAGIDPDPELIRLGGFRPERTRVAAQQLLTREPRPTAIFAANDASALETIAVADELGLSIPGDLSVIGFDNVPASALSQPPLTTIDQSVKRMGYEAIRLVLELIEDPPEEYKRHVVLRTQLVERASCAPPSPHESSGRV
jgi:LacI family transcriptional regulator